MNGTGKTARKPRYTLKLEPGGFKWGRGDKPVWEGIGGPVISRPSGIDDGSGREDCIIRHESHRIYTLCTFILEF